MLWKKFQKASIFWKKFEDGYRTRKRTYFIDEAYIVKNVRKGSEKIVRSF